MASPYRKLLIVESPGKLKTLRKILGADWLLDASVGHTTELAHDGPKKLGFSLDQGKIETRYVPRGDRGKQVLSKLRAAVRQADQVYLAMDPDREGEAIAWHLAQQLKLKKYFRVSYTQITESSVKAAIQNPRQLDLPLIFAQRARQCLDKLVGFEVSPLLWNSTGGKSAGRVQTATLHLLCQREHERLKFVPEDYWTLHALYGEGLKARYEPARPAELTLIETPKVRTESEAKQIEAIARSHPHQVEAIENREERRSPLPPLITSSLQQTAGVRLKYSPQKTMKIAQELYEGVGGQGLITYMRTDAVALSPEFVSEARAWLRAEAPEALAASAPVYKMKEGAQAAHEAIRPTSVYFTPAKAKATLNHEQYEIYNLIWNRAVASQCRPAVLARGQIKIRAGTTLWVARGMQIIEEGYLKFWKNIEDETELPLVRQGQILNLKKIETEKKTTEPPPRYSEAKLVQLMEKLGIGRPSTYASTIMTLKDREYATLENTVLAPTPLGMATDGALVTALPDLTDVRFTAQMEKSLDQIAEGKLDWEKFLCGWNTDYLEPALIKARVSLRGFTPVVRSFSAGEKKSKSFKKSKFRFTKKSATARTDRGEVAAKPARKTKRAPVRRKPRPAAVSANAAGAHPPSDAPSCQRGHGALSARVSKKGDPYFKCAEPGCDSWHWPG
jgi:DNA topoisomerase-1